MYENLITIPELAEQLRVQVSWVYGKTRETGPDAIPRVRVGKYIRFEKAAVDAWLEKQNRRN
jgi:excisionase family DNA binding protein